MSQSIPRSKQAQQSQNLTPCAPQPLNSGPGSCVGKVIIVGQCAKKKNFQILSNSLGKPESPLTRPRALGPKGGLPARGVAKGYWMCILCFTNKKTLAHKAMKGVLLNFGSWQRGCSAIKIASKANWNLFGFYTQIQIMPHSVNP